MEQKMNPENDSTDAAAMEHPAGEGSVRPEDSPPAVAVEQQVTAPAAPEPSASEASPVAADSLPEATQQEPPVGLEEPPAGAPATVDPQSADGTDKTLLQDKNQSVIEHLERFEAQLTEHLRNNASCSRTAFDYLYDEMQAYKTNFLRDAQRPLLLDLMMLYDSIDKLRRNYEQAATVDPLTLYQNLDALQVEAEEILGRVGIERMSATPEKLDVNLQRAVKTIPTDDPEQHLLVVEQIRSGFVSGEQTLRKEQVVVKKYTSPAPSASTTAE